MGRAPVADHEVSDTSRAGTVSEHRLGTRRKRRGPSGGLRGVRITRCLTPREGTPREQTPREHRPRAPAPLSGREMLRSSYLARPEPRWSTRSARHDVWPLARAPRAGASPAARSGSANAGERVSHARNAPHSRDLRPRTVPSEPPDVAVRSCTTRASAIRGPWRSQVGARRISQNSSEFRSPSRRPSHRCWTPLRARW